MAAIVRLISKFNHHIPRFDLPVVGLLIFINGIVLANAIRHDPLQGYDSEHHYRNIVIISTGHLPSPDDSREFFSPPLPYVLPALLLRLAGLEVWEAGKVAQLFNWILSIGVTVYLVKICELMRPSQPVVKRGALLSLAVIPVYYKTFAFVRGEPFVVFFTLVSAYLALQAMIERRLSYKKMMGLGAALGMALLSRQWGALLIPVIILFLCVIAFKTKLRLRRLLGGLAICLGICVLIGGWFYGYLKINYGTVTAFNRPPQPYFLLSNQPAEFYLGSGNGLLFLEPVRESFPNQFAPIFYSEIWGDYWFYFLVYGKDIRRGDIYLSSSLYKMLNSPRPNWFVTNRDTILPYLARLNRVGLYPTALALLALVLGSVRSLRFVLFHSYEPQDGASFLFLSLMGVSMLGYMWFLIMYPFEIGDTIKASYMLHLFPLASILVGELYLRIRRGSLFAYRILMILAILVLLHNLAALLSRITGG